MKSYIIYALMCAALLVGAPCLGGEGDCLMSFGTKGPDCYADGSAVLDGEYYALVAQSVAAGDVSFTHDGRVANTNEAMLLRALPLAENGRCPETKFAVNDNQLPKFSKKTCLRLYLLDTRVYEGGVARVGGCGCVQATVPVTGVIAPASVTTDGQADASRFVRTQLTEDVVSPVIMGIRFEGDDIVLTVSRTMPHVNYVVGHAAFKAKGRGACKGAKPATRLGGKDEIELRVPRGAADSGFFQVQRQ